MQARSWGLPDWWDRAGRNWRWPCSGPRLHRGDVTLDGEPMPHRDPAGCIEAGMLMLTESRKDDGLFMNSSVARNFAADNARLWCASKLPSRRGMRKNAPQS